jgi:hypothetical protein
MLVSVCKNATTLIFLDFQLVHHFVDGTSIDSTTSAEYCIHSGSGTIMSFYGVHYIYQLLPGYY